MIGTLNRCLEEVHRKVFDRKSVSPLSLLLVNVNNPALHHDGPNNKKVEYLKTWKNTRKKKRGKSPEISSRLFLSSNMNFTHAKALDTGTNNDRRF